MSTSPTDRYTLISADCHAGGSHEQYREYLESKYHEDFDAWRGSYRSPWRDLEDRRLRLRNWDNELRNSELLAQGVVGEVIFPNTVPPFFPSTSLLSAPPGPDDYVHRLAGIRAHNRWLADWCADFPERRAGVGQIFINDVDDAIADVHWINEHGLRGGVLLPNIPPDVRSIRGLYDASYEPLWAVCEDLDVPVNTHSGGTGSPRYPGSGPAGVLLMVAEERHYSQQPFVHLLLSGVFERHPRLRFVMTEMGAAWVPRLLRRLDCMLTNIHDTGRLGEHPFPSEFVPPKTATEYFRQNCWLGLTTPQAADVEILHEIGLERCMWGADYPHSEGTYPFTTEHLRQQLWKLDPVDLSALLGGNAASFYGFDLAALASLASEYGPTVEEVARPLEELPEDANMVLLGTFEPMLA